MYKNSQFEEKDADKVLAFMKAHSFISLIGHNGEFPVVTQIPVHIYQDGHGIRLVGHIMKKTDHHEAYAKDENVLALFTGAHSYVSAAVYENPAVASTWNYSSVQCRGKIKLLGEEETREIIKHLTDSYEDPKTSPAAFHKMDEAYIDKNLKAIVGFEIMVETINHVFKLSQNHSRQNREKIVANLAQNDNHDSKEIAKQMREML